MSNASKSSDNTSQEMQVYSFALLLAGIEELTDQLESAVFEAGCDDALLGIRCGVPYLAFDRKASSLEEAIKSAIKAVESIRDRGISIEVTKVVPGGEETIEDFNAYLTTRRKLFSVLKDLPPDERQRIASVFGSVLD